MAYVNGKKVISQVKTKAVLVDNAEATNISYDNTYTKLRADNVQDAIDFEHFTNQEQLDAIRTRINTGTPICIKVNTVFTKYLESITDIEDVNKIKQAMKKAYDNNVPLIIIDNDNVCWLSEYFSGDLDVYFTSVGMCANDPNILYQINIWCGDEQDTELNFSYTEIECAKLEQLQNTQKELTEAKKEILDLQEALYGYVLDTAIVDIDNIIPSSVSVDNVTYNLCDNVRGLIASVNGNSAISENLILINDTASTNDIYFSKGELHIKAGTYAQGRNINFTLVNSIEAGTYTGVRFGEAYSDSKAISVFITDDYQSQLSLNTSQTKTTTVTCTKLRVYFDKEVTLTSEIVIKPMLVKGDVAPTEFKQGFSGIKSVEYKKLNIYGENLLQVKQNSFTNITNATISVNNSLFKIECSNNTYPELNILLEAGTYTATIFIQQCTAQENIWVQSSLGEWIDYNKNIIVKNTIKQNSLTFTITKKQNIKFIFALVTNSTFVLEGYISLVKGSTPPTTFKPYRATRYLLPYMQTLRGINNVKDKIVINKNTDNTYSAILVRYIAEIDLSTLVYSYEDSTNRFISELLSNAKKPSNSNVANILCAKYTTVSFDTIYNNLNTNNIISLSANNYISIRDTQYTDAAAFKQSLNGVMCQYELATPTEEVLANNLTNDEVMAILELGGSIELDNDNKDFVNGNTSVEMVYKKIGGSTNE